MSIFFAVLGGIVLFIAGVIPLGACLAVWIVRSGDTNDWPLRTKIATNVVCILLLAVVITIAANWIGSVSGSDASSHCGPGTRYVSESHLVGKTIITDWACVAP